jgi:hypothetical protein
MCSEDWAAYFGINTASMCARIKKRGMERALDGLVPRTVTGEKS